MGRLRAYEDVEDAEVDETEQLLRGVGLVNGDISVLENGKVVEHKRGQVSMGMCVFLMVNSILGSAVLSLPISAANAGVIPFVLLLAFFGVLASLGLFYLLLLSEMLRVPSFEALGNAAFGRRGELLVCIVVMVQNIGAMTSYLVILRSQLPQVLSEIICHSQNCWPNETQYQAALTIAITFGIVLPLCLLREIGKLAYSSMLSFFTMSAFAVIVILAKFIPALANPCVDAAACEAQLVHITPDLFRSLPTMAFSFVCHTAVLPTYSGLKNPTRSKMNKVAGIAVIICYCLYLSSALFAYSTYGQTLKRNVLDNTPNGNVVIQTLKLCFALAVVLTVPIVHFPFRMSAQQLFFRGKPYHWARHLGLTLGAVVLLLILALFVPSIQDVFSVAGATSSVTIMGILPGLFYVRLKPPPWTFDRIVAAGMVVVSAMIGVGCLTAVILGFFQS